MAHPQGRFRIRNGVVVGGVLLALVLVAASLPLMFLMLPPLVFPPVACAISAVLFALCCADRSKSWRLRLATLSPIPFAVAVFVLFLGLMSKEHWH